MRFAAGNAQHIGARSQQEDAFGFSDPTDRDFAGHAGLLGVVADGMGGLARGSEASRVAVRSFLDAYEAKRTGDPIPQALSRSLAAAQSAVLALNRDGSSVEEAGTTLAAAVLHRNALHWIGAGDSRIYLLRHGRLTRVTMDHVFARRLHEQVADGTMTRAEAREHPDRSSLTSYLGMARLADVDRSVRPIPLEPGDRVILCTDGLYRALTEAEFAGAFRSSLNRTCDTLTRLALKKRRAQQDNLTVIALSHEPDATKYLPAGHRRFAGRRLALAAAACLLLLALATLAYRERHLVAAPWAWIKAATGVSDSSAPGPAAAEAAPPAPIRPVSNEAGAMEPPATASERGQPSSSATAPKAKEEVQ